MLTSRRQTRRNIATSCLASALLLLAASPLIAIASIPAAMISAGLATVIAVVSGAAMLYHA